MSDLSGVPTSELLKYLTDEQLKQIAGITAEEPASQGIPLGEYTAFPEAGSKKVARAGIETLGTAGGGAVGSLLGPAGTIGGETLGYAGSSKLADLLLDENTGTWGRKLAEGGAFSVVPRAVFGTIAGLGKGAVRSAIKIPPTQQGRKEAAQVVNTIVEEGLPVSERGVGKAKGIIQTAEKAINDALSKSGSTVDVEKLVSAVDDLRPQFKYSSDPAGANAALDDVVARIRSHPTAVDGKIPINEAHKLKKGLYQEIKSYYQRQSGLSPKSNLAADTDIVGIAKWAKSLRNEVMSDPTMPKEATNWLKREENVVNALRWIERRANVAANMDPITFNDVLLGGLLREGVPYAVAVRFARSPKYLSYAGIYMARAKNLARPVQAGAIATKNLLTD